MLVLVVVIFALFWLPVHIHLLVAYFDELPDNTFYEVVSIFWNCLAYFNSCVNPIIYNHTSKDFRDAFIEVAHCGHRLPNSAHSNSNTTLVVRLVPGGDGVSRRESRQQLSVSPAFDRASRHSADHYV